MSEMKLKINYGIHHVGINVSDIGKALNFYRDLLGMQVMARERGEGFEVVFLLMPETTTQLELVYYEPDPASPRSRGYEYTAIGAQHLCFETRDIEKVYRRLEQAQMISLEKLECVPQQGVKFFYARDPDGSVIEFMEMRPQDAPFPGGLLANLLHILLWLVGILLRKQAERSFAKRG